jgi:hypothetical protein
LVSRSLHPAEHRGYRELYALARQLADHWSAVAARLQEDDAAKPFGDGAAAARTLLDELAEITARYGLHGEFAAQGVAGNAAGSLTGLRDRFLELGQGLRFAVAELQHVTTLLGYLASLADARSDEQLAEFDRRWERKLRRIESAARKAAIELGARPDRALERFDPSALGRVAHGAAYLAGTIGEWSDRQLARRSKRTESE